MTTLYIDTSFNLALALLNKEFKVIEFFSQNEKKQSTILHTKIDELLKRHHLNLSEVKKIVFAAGPGSYTGMRLSAGLTDIMKWQGYSINCFYHFEIPKFLGINNYLWLGKAFKGEIFCFEYPSLKTWKIKETEIKQFLSLHDNKIVTTYSIEDLGIELENIVELKGKISEEITSLSKQICERNSDLDLYYYRSIEEEFVVPKSKI